MDKTYKIMVNVLFYLVYISCLINLVIDPITIKTKIGIIAGSIALFSKYMALKSKGVKK